MADYEPKAGGYSYRTQEIVNELPDWDGRRRLRTSVGQQIVNATAGQQHEQIWDEAERALRNKFLATVEMDQPDLVTKVELQDSVSLNPPQTIRNYLFNSSFEIWPNQAELPQLWQYSGTGTISDLDTGFVGNKALGLSTASGESVSIYQDIEVPIPAGQEWSFSTWYSIDSSLGLTAPATGFGMEAIGYLSDATVETIRESFTTDTSGRPTKLSMSGSFSKDVSKVRVQLVCSNTGAFTFTDTVTVDLVSARPGDLATPWTPHPLDNWPHVKVRDIITPILVESGNRAQYVETLDDFWIKAVPTRVGYLTMLTDEGDADAAPAPVNGVTSYGTAGRWIETDTQKEDWPYTIEAYSVGSSHKLRMIGSEVPDILGVFDIGFRNWRDYFEVDTNIEIEAITWFGSYLWVVHKKYDYNSVQKRYLSVVDAKTPWPRPSYLEAFVTLELPTPSLGTLITRAEFRWEDQQHLYIGDGSTTYVYNLYYDYFQINDRTIYLREDSDSITIVEAEPQRRELTADLDKNQMQRTVRS